MEYLTKGVKSNLRNYESRKTGKDRKPGKVSFDYFNEDELLEAHLSKIHVAKLSLLLNF